MLCRDETVAEQKVAEATALKAKVLTIPPKEQKSIVFVQQSSGVISSEFAAIEYAFFLFLFFFMVFFSFLIVFLFSHCSQLEV